MVQEQLGEEAQILAVDLVRLSVHLVNGDAAALAPLGRLAVDLVPRRVPAGSIDRPHPKKIEASVNIKVGKPSTSVSRSRSQPVGQVALISSVRQPASRSGTSHPVGQPVRRSASQ